MSTTYVTVARFTQPLAAHQAKGMLEDEGVPAFLLGDNIAPIIPGIGDHIGGIEIQVAAADADRAYEILEEHLREQDLDAIQEAGPDEVATWTCSACGERVGSSFSACPSCGTPTDAFRSKEEIQVKPSGHFPEVEMPASPSAETPSTAIQTSADAALAPPPAVGELDDDELNVENLEQRFADDLAWRAFRMAATGCLLTPLLFCVSGLLVLPMPLLLLGLGTFVLSALFVVGVFGYSFWLLFRLALLPGELSRYAVRRVYLALLMDVPAFVFFVLIVRASIP
jgi:hypothetical protein